MNNLSSHSDMLTRRSFLLKALALAVAGCGIPMQSVLAQAADLSKVVLRIADMKGGDDSFFTLAGVNNTPYRTRLVRLGQASLSAEALNAGAYDLSLQSNIASVFLPPASPIRLAGFVGFRAEAFKLYVRRGSGINAPDQIKGKRVAYMRGGPLHLFLLEILKQEGLSLNDIRPVALSAQDSASAFSAGSVDVVLAGMFAPSYQIEQRGGELLVGGDHYPGFAHNNGFSAAVHRQILADPLKAQAAADYFQRLQKTWQWLDDNESVWAEEMGRLFGVPAEFIIRHRPRPYNTKMLPSSEGLFRMKYIAQAFFDGEAIPALPDIDRLWDSNLESLLPIN